MNLRHCAELLLDAGAKARGDAPVWLNEMLAKRRHVNLAALAFIGILRKRFHIRGAHIGTRIPQDLATMLATYVRKTRFDTQWI